MTLDEAHETTRQDGRAAGHLAERVDELDALFQLTDKLYRARSMAEVYDAALDAIIAVLGCERASVLLFDEAGVMSFVAWRGLSEHYRTTLAGHSPWKPGDRAPRPIFVTDIDDTDESETVKATIRAEGIRGLAFVPLEAQGAVVGKFMTYYRAPHRFSDHEVDLAVTIARQIGFSLEREMAERARRQAAEELRHSEEQFRLMTEHAPVMMWNSDAQGRCLHLNKMLRAFWGVGEEDVDGFDWRTTMHPEDAPAIGAAMMAALAERRPAKVKGRYRDAAGHWRVLETDARPRFSARGELAGMIGVNVDVTEREEADRALRESEERFRLAVEAAPSGMVMTDAAGRIVLVNEQVEHLLGYRRDEIVGQAVEMLVPERFRAAHPALRAAYGASPSARPMGAERDLCALHRDGRDIPVEIGLSPILTADGFMTLAAIVDISERKRADAQRDLLLAELNHRVKNTLAIVQSIAHQTLRNATAAEAAAALDGRLIALAGAHNLLTQTNWESASLQQLAAEALQAAGGRDDRFALSGPEILLGPKHAVALAMALHELYTNAVKYGALSAEGGRIALSWERTAAPEPRLAIEWRESGGPPVQPPTRRGFGSRLVERMLALDLDAEVSMDFRPEGVVCTISAPLRAATGERH